MLRGFLGEPSVLMGILLVCSLLPLLVVVGTCFLKLCIVFNLLRNAIGTQQVPPNMALYGLALILTVFIMSPVALQVQDNVNKVPIQWETKEAVQQFDQTVLEPYRNFLTRFAGSEHVDFFSRISMQIWPEPHRHEIPRTSLVVLMPAFALTQLVEGFKIGFLLYLPFIAIDLIVSNILLAMGMMMVSPLTIALPFKLLVFVLIGGWERLMEQLVLSYAY